MSLSKPAFSLLILLMVLIFGAFLLYFFIQNPGLVSSETPGARDKLNQSELKSIQEGDLILIRGQGLSSDFIMLILGEDLKVSHVGFIIKIDNEPWVIHTVNSSLSGVDGMQLHNLTDFISHAAANTIVISRPRWPSQNGVYAMREKAVGLAKQLHAQKIPFDNSYNPDDQSELYCTELINLLLKQSGYWPPELKPQMKGPFILFSNFISPEYFDIVIDHRRPG